LHRLGEGHAFRQQLHRERLVVGLIRAHNILRRMPEPMPSAKMITVLPRRACRDLEKNIPGFSGRGAERDDAWADRRRDREFEGATREGERLAAAIISLRGFHGKSSWPARARPPSTSACASDSSPAPGF